MMKREALEKCMDQWQRIHTELYKMDAMQRDDELFQIPTFSMLKRKALRSMGVSDDDHPINWCYMCEYTLVDGVPDCLVCPLKGYAWEQCETDGSYLACEDAYDEECFGEAADYAQEIIDACAAALEDLDDKNEYRADRLIAAVIITVFFATTVVGVAGAYTAATIRQKLIRERTQEHVSLWTAFWYPNNWFTTLDIIEIPIDEEPQG